MEIEIKDATTLPQWLQSHVADGKLNLAAVPAPEDVSGLKTALQKERANSQAWAKLGEAPDAVAQRIEALEKAAQGTGKGAEEAQAKLDAMKAEGDAKANEWQDKYRAALQRQAMAELKTELASAGVLPKYLNVIAAEAMARVKFGDNGEAQIFKEDGSTMLGTGENYSPTFADLAQEVSSGYEEIRVDKGNGGSGKPPNSGGTPDRKTITRKQFDGMSHAERAEFSTSGGKVTDD